MDDNDEIKITRKDWHLLKLVFRHVTWGRTDLSEAWKNFVDSVESRLDEAAAPMTESNEAKSD